MKADGFEVSTVNVIGAYRSPETMSELAADKWLTAARRNGVELLTYQAAHRSHGDGLYTAAWCVGTDEMVYLVQLDIERNRIAAVLHGPAVRKEEG